MPAKISSFVLLAFLGLSSAQYDHEGSPAHYSFQYGVRDDTTGDVKEHQEERHGEVTRGVYSLVEPDGSRRIVEYSSQPGIGFNAIVHREPNQHSVRSHVVQATVQSYVQPIVQHHVQPVVQHHVQAQPIAHHVVQPVVSHVAHPVVSHVAQPVVTRVVQPVISAHVASPLVHHQSIGPVHHQSPVQSYYQEPSYSGQDNGQRASPQNQGNSFGLQYPSYLSQDSSQQSQQQGATSFPRDQYSGLQNRPQNQVSDIRGRGDFQRTVEADYPQHGNHYPSRHY